ncbi:MAG: hypothetical protein P4L36_15195 [Holophaga sp.]|nr:hypothetical protein [Holophaga sp.]
MIPHEVLARFSYAPPSRQDHLPHRSSAPPAPLALAGTAGECLLALTEGYGIPEAMPPVLGRDVQAEDGWILPPRLLVVRGDLAYEFSYAALPRPDQSPWAAHYRLTAVRAPSGENLTFTYGPNGVDFEAAWMAARVRVTMEAAEGIAPVPALDAGFPALDSKPPGEAFHDVAAHLRIAYEGPKAVPDYMVSTLLRAEDLTPTIPPSDSRQDAATRPEALPPPYPGPLQVVRIQVDDSEEAVEFSYGKAPAVNAVNLAGPEEMRHYPPTVVQGIVFPIRSFRLDWEPQPGPCPPGQMEDGGWSFGVKAIHEQGAATYHRAAQPASSTSFADPDGQEAAGGPSWVRQSRHFAFAPTSSRGGSCKTFIRDRWVLQGKRDPEPPQASGSIPCQKEGDIPTFEWDFQRRTLVAVPGEMTRRLTWEPGMATAPDLHQAGDRDRTATGGLKGGAPGEGSREANPSGNPNENVQMTPIRFDPIRNEVTMGAIAGGHLTPSPAAPPPIFPPAESPNVLGQWVTRNQQDIQQTVQQAFAAAEARQVLANQQNALTQAAHDTRMGAIQDQMAERALAQSILAQARSQAPPYPMAGVAVLPLPEHFQPLVEAQRRIQETHQRIQGTQQGIQETQQGIQNTLQRIKEGQRRAAEKLRYVAEVQKRAAEAQRLAKEAQALAEAKRQQETEAQRRAQEEQQRLAAERARQAAEAARRQQEAEAQRRAQEEQQRLAAEGARQAAEAARRQKEAEIQRRSQEEKQRLGEAQKYATVQPQQTPAHDQVGGENRQRNAPASGRSESKAEKKGEAAKQDPYSLAGPPVPGWPKLAGPIPDGEQPAKPGVEDSKISAEHLKNWWTGGGWNKDADAERVRPVRTVEGWGPDAPDHLRAPERYIDYNKFGEVVQVRDARGIQDDSATTLAIVTGAKIAKDVRKAAVTATRGQTGRLPAGPAASGSGITQTKPVQELLKPGGELIGTIQKGATAEVRTVSSSEFTTLQQELLVGAKPSGTYAGGKGTWYNLPNGGRVGVRSSKESGLTLDIDIPGLPKGLKVHQQ